MAKVDAFGCNHPHTSLGDLSFRVSFASKTKTVVIESLGLPCEDYPSRIRIDLRGERGYAPVSTKTH